VDYGWLRKFKRKGQEDITLRLHGSLSLLIVLALAVSFSPARAERIRVASSSPSLTARLPHFVAHEEGFFMREGLQVESIVVRNDAIILSALAAGEFDYVETGAPAPVSAISKSLPFVIIGGFRSRLDYLLIGRRGLSTIAELKGAKLGATGPGGLSESVLVAGMKKLGYQKDKDYTLLYVGNSPLRMIALEQGRIDASIFSPQQHLMLTKNGYSAITDIGKLLPDMPALVLSTRRDKIKSNPDQTVRFLRAMNQAMEFIKSNPDRAVEDARKQRYSGDLKAEREALNYYIDTFSIGFNAANLESLIELTGTKTQLKPADFFDASFGARARGN
jgi:ABC-type nitrate/sulfonate/bicarbonate transport system substrate-binding protein